MICNNHYRNYRDRFRTAFCYSLPVLFFWILPARVSGAAADSLVYDSFVSDPVHLRTEWGAVKNNLLYDAILTPNLEVEFHLAPQWTLELGAGFNPFPLDDTRFPKWRHLEAHIAPRYWFCNAFHRDFISLNAAYVHYNVAGGRYPIGWLYRSVMNSRFQGDAVMGGLSYGWHFAVSPHFSVELELGADAGYSWFDRFECKHCGNKTGSGGRWFVLPKAGISLVVPLGGDEASLARRCDCEKQDDVVEEVVEEPVEVQIDTLPMPVDTVEIVDTLVHEPIDTIVSEQPADTLAVEHQEQMQRLRNGVFRPYSEYVPYTREMVLSEDTNAIYLHFDVGVSEIVEDYMHNDEILDSIMAIMAEYMDDERLEIRLIQIVGMASFDGAQQGNERLAQNRAIALRDYIKGYYDLPDAMFVLCNGGEGWAELEWHIRQREFEGKDEVLRIIATELNQDVRERKIKRLHNGAVYQYLKQHVTLFQRNAGNLIVYYETKQP